MTTANENTTEDLVQATSDVQEATVETKPEPASAPESTDLRTSIASALEAHHAEPKAPEKKAAPATSQETAEPVAQVDPITGRTVEPINPPASLTPSLREKWSKVDPQFQKYWIDRERDMAQMMQSTSDDRKYSKEIRGVIAPYEQMLREGGVSAAGHISDLLKISSVLHTGTPLQKAGLFHELLTRYQPDINALMALSQGQAVQIPQMQAPAPKPSEQEIADKVLSEREEKQREAEAVQAAEKFAADPANEFFDYLRPRMAALVTAGVFDHLTTTEAVYKAAYEMAKANDPEIQAVLRQRAASLPSVATTPAVPAQELPRSVKPGLGTGKQKTQRHATSRSAAEAAWDSLRN